MKSYQVYINEASKDITLSSGIDDDTGDQELFFFMVGSKEVSLLDATVFTEDGVVVDKVDYNEEDGKVPSDVKKWIDKELKVGVEITKSFKKKFDSALLKKFK